MNGLALDFATTARLITFGHHLTERCYPSALGLCYCQSLPHPAPSLTRSPCFVCRCTRALAFRAPQLIDASRQPSATKSQPNSIITASSTSTDNMTDYAKMKNADLEALLKQRSLPHTGKKADMVARLQEADKADPDQANAEQPAASTTAPPEDEIDWDDDTTDAKPAAAAASTEAGATAIKAGGQGPVANPQAVPNQVADVDPSKTDDLSVKAPEGDGATDEPAAESAAEAAPVEKKDFTSGIKETTLDEELEKRKARAKKFGLPEEEDDQAKLLERAKKFGTDAAPTGPRGLNEALPERRPKRGREAGDEGTRGNNKRRGRGGRGDRSQGRRGGGGGGGERRGNDSAKNNAGGSGGSWMNSDDKAKADARKARFAGAPSAS